MYIQYPNVHICTWQNNTTNPQNAKQLLRLNLTVETELCESWNETRYCVWENTRVWEDLKIKDFKKSKNSYRSACEGQAAVWATFRCQTGNFTRTEATRSNRPKSHFTPSSLDHHLPAGWERSSRRACPSDRRSDEASASRFRWTWSPGSHRGGAGFVAAPCPRSEMGWTSSPLQGEWRRSKDRFVIRILIYFDHDTFLDICVVRDVCM